MPKARSAPAAPTCSGLLVHLLTHEDRYRRQWRAHVQRQSRQGLHRSAVSAVLAAHLWEEGEVAEEDHGLPRRMKDVVSRALSGQLLSAPTLAHFIGAFEMSDVHARQLWAAYEEDRAGPGAPVVPSRPPGRSFRRPACHTVQLDEHHVVGADGLPVRHRTRQVIQALEPMAHYSCRVDTSAVSVDVARGGVAGPTYATDQPGLFGIDIHFPRMLQPQETRVLEYTTWFEYRDPPPPEFRRGVRRTVGSVAIQVDFHPDRLPQRVWWAAWERLDAPPVARELVHLDETHSVHRFTDEVRDEVIGFLWQWPEAR